MQDVTVIKGYGDKGTYLGTSFLGGGAVFLEVKKNVLEDVGGGGGGCYLSSQISSSSEAPIGVQFAHRYISNSKYQTPVNRPGMRNV